MTVSDLIRILRQYEREFGEDTFVVFIDDNENRYEADAVGFDGDIVITND